MVFGGVGGIGEGGIILDYYFSLISHFEQSPSPIDSHPSSIPQMSPLLFMSIHPSIHSFTNYLWSPFHLQGAILGAAVNVNKSNSLSFPPPGDLPNPGIEHSSPVAPALAGRFFTTEPPGKSICVYVYLYTHMCVYLSIYIN